MNVFSLRTLIDDILLIVRNNNISESEDLSRDQIRAWILAYKAYLTKKKHDKDKETGEDTQPDDSLSTTIGPLTLQGDDSKKCPVPGLKRTKEKLPSLLGDSANDIVNITDSVGCAIQVMNPSRKHYHNFRRYTASEPVAYYKDGYIYLEGEGIDELRYIYVTGNFTEGPEGSDADEDDVEIPGWMVPDIKKAIMDNELSFMLKRPSDDSNNSTLASVKPHGPQDKEA